LPEAYGKGKLHEALLKVEKTPADSLSGPSHKDEELEKMQNSEGKFQKEVVIVRLGNGSLESAELKDADSFEKGGMVERTPKSRRKNEGYPIFGNSFSSVKE